MCVLSRFSIRTIIVRILVPVLLERNSNKIQRAENLISMMVRAEVPVFLLANPIMRVSKMDKEGNTLWLDESELHWDDYKNHL